MDDTGLGIRVANRAGPQTTGYTPKRLSEFSTGRRLVWPFPVNAKKNDAHYAGPSESKDAFTT